MLGLHTITPCLWFDDQAEAAAQFYTAIFRHSRIVNVARYGDAGHEIHGKPAGTVMVVAFELDGQAFTALNGGPMFTFNEAISFQVTCETQADVDCAGRSFLRAEMLRPSSAAGSRTNTVCHGKWCLACCPRCSVIPMRQNPNERWWPCFR